MYSAVVPKTLTVQCALIVAV